MNELKGFSIQELQNEIKRRINNKPELLPNIDWEPVIDFVCNEVVNKSIKDHEALLFEMVMETMFGDNIWEWWNNKENAAPQSDQ